VQSVKAGYHPAFFFSLKILMTAKAADLLPSQAVFKLQQSPGTPDSKQLARLDQLIVLLPEQPAAKLWGQIPEGRALEKLARKPQLKSQNLRTRLKNTASTSVIVGRLAGSGKGNKPPASFALLSSAGAIVKAALQDKPAAVGILVRGFDAEFEAAAVQALVLALSAHDFALPNYKSSATPARHVKTVHIFNTEQRLDLERTLSEAAGLNLARWLTVQPPNKLDAGGYRTAISALAKQHGWKMSFLNEAKLKQLGAGAFLAVTQGNANKDAGIVHLQYRPKNSGKTPALALVGKGIIFDTGGVNLKPFKGMLDMHADMAGSAVALGTLTALTELQVPYAIDCWLAITENCIGSTAYKSRDIVTASNGVTIEVIHTDAEGRMVLADTLALAGKAKPPVIIDFATLTGSCVHALTDRYSGVLTNRPQLNQLLIDAGKASGERVWPFPMDDDFDEDLNSTVADVLQCATVGGGDHIQAALLLQRFIPDSSTWVHLDLSAANRSAGLAQVPGNITGFGVRYATNLILNHLDDLATAAKGNNA
jgi:leucyl aminopeptidase